MDLDIIKIAADTSNNKILEDYTHKSKYKNKTWQIMKISKRA